MVNGEPETVSLGPARIPTDERDEPGEGKSLPTLETLIRRIPAETRAALDELFRAKFIAVRRVPERALKSG